MTLSWFRYKLSLQHNIFTIQIFRSLSYCQLILCSEWRWNRSDFHHFRFSVKSSWLIWDCLAPFACSKCSNDYFVVSDSTSANKILIPSGSISHFSIRHSSRSFRYKSWVCLRWIIWTDFTNHSLSSAWFSISRLGISCMLNVNEGNIFLKLSLLVEISFLHVFWLLGEKKTAYSFWSFIFI